ncbi:Fic family protein [Desulfobacterales bacterium HSG2]|nr:Fic family protein [Desulfobacterales bacterium HSG2]
MQKYYKIRETRELRSLLDTVDDLMLRIDSRKPRWAAIQERLRIDWTYDSNAIEGSSLTRDETLFFLREGLTVEGKPFKDFLDARNHAEAIDYLYELTKEERPLTQGVIRELNALLLSGVNYTEAINETGQKIRKPASPGKYKTLPNHVLQPDGTIHFYTDPLHVPDEMEMLCRWIRDNLDIRHPLVTGAAAHYNMVRIHPFDDGNGRGARILMNLILIKRGYPPAIIRNKDRRRYITALSRADRGDMRPFLNLTAESLISTQKIILKELAAGIP